MILVADCGSTKSEWCLIDRQGKIGESLFTPGMNPYFLTSEEIKEIIRQELYSRLGKNNSQITAIHFYGAGCATPEKCKKIADALKSYWQVQVFVYSDLVAAAHALCGNKAGIPCILGTGSNSCLYNGTEIEEHISPLGFILGDEGSGAALGRALVSNCLKHQLPESICRHFLKEYQLTQEQILDRVYHQLLPNRFLASLTPFLKKYIWEENIYNMVYKSFQSFFERNVMLYTGYDRYPVHFVGSVAYHFQKVLCDVMQALSIEVGRIEQSPMDGLIQYHISSFK